MVMLNGKLVNTYIRTLYSEGFSSIMFSFFNTNLALNFARYIGKNNYGFPQFDLSKTLKTTINYEAAACLYQTTMEIIEGLCAEKEISAVLQCNNNTTLTFEYKQDEYNQMRGYLIINKNNEIIPFQFRIHLYKVKENGQFVTKIIQSGLGVFAKTLEGYLTGVNADGHLGKLPDAFENHQSEDQYTP